MNKRIARRFWKDLWQDIKHDLPLWIFCGIALGIIGVIGWLLAQIPKTIQMIIVGAFGIVVTLAFLIALVMTIRESILMRWRKAKWEEEKKQ